MKKTTFILMLTGAATLSFVSCKNMTKSTQKQTTTETTTTINNTRTENTMDVDKLLALAEQQIGDTITFKGKVKHTCSHSGRRCFIANPTGETTIRVEVGGNIKSFNKELVGSEIELTGILREQRLSQEYIDKWEKELKQEEAEGEKDTEHCNSEKNNILQMREWMKKNNKDFYAIYYVDGQNYEIIK